MSGGGGSRDSRYRDWREGDPGTSWSRFDWDAFKGSDDKPYTPFSDFLDFWRQKAGGGGGDAGGGSGPPPMGWAARQPFTFHGTPPDMLASQLIRGFGPAAGILASSFTPSSTVGGKFTPKIKTGKDDKE